MDYSFNDNQQTYQVIHHLVNILIGYSPFSNQKYTAKLPSYSLLFILVRECKQNFSFTAKRQKSTKEKNGKSKLSLSGFETVIFSHSLQILSRMPNPSDKAEQLPVHLQNVVFGACNLPTDYNYKN